MGGELLDGVLAVRAGHARGNRLPSAGGEAAVDGSVVDGDLAADLDGRGRRGSAAGLGDVIKGNPADAGFQFPPFGSASAVGFRDNIPIDNFLFMGVTIPVETVNGRNRRCTLGAAIGRLVRFCSYGSFSCEIT